MNATSADTKWNFFTAETIDYTKNDESGEQITAARC